LFRSFLGGGWLRDVAKALALAIIKGHSRQSATFVGWFLAVMRAWMTANRANWFVRARVGHNQLPFSLAIGGLRELSITLSVTIGE
jgi:hypothetical protein